MWIAVALCAIAFWLAIFFTFFQADEEALRARLPKKDGKFPELNVWLTRKTAADGSYEEERFLQEGRTLYRQRRRRDAEGNIVEVLLDEKVR